MATGTVTPAAAPASELAVLAEKYDLRVPRYTSYPTAPHFSAAVDAATYRRWLAALDPGASLSLYFHIPFCDTMCWFCGCYTKIVARYEPVAAYLEVLLAEIDLIAAALPTRMTARHLHWGGGSPTMLTGSDWRRTLDALRARFQLADDAEVAVEFDPRETTEAYVAALAEAGVNRASIGVQDFDPEVQQAINRDQPFEVVERVVGWLRRHGITAVNLDLMYGLPYQTPDRVRAMVDRALSLAPDRIALFGYAHVPWMKAHQKIIDETALPGAAARLDQLTAATGLLIARGYRAVGLDHFARHDDPLARTGTMVRRNFQGYTTDDADVLLGFGASAIGALPRGYVQNAAPLAAYEAAIRGGEPATTRGLALTADDRLRAEIIERLMCEMAVDVEAACRRHGADPGALDPAIASLAPLVADGLATVTGRRIAATATGRPFLRLIAAAFDAYLGAGGVRHSRAV